MARVRTATMTPLRSDASRSRKRTTPPEVLYQLKVTLRGFRPPIWRRLLVGGNTTLGELHVILQIAMGWTDSHLHNFTIGTTTYSDWEKAGLGGFDFPEDEDETGVRLWDVARSPGAKFEYCYDMGDSWEHQILVEKIRPPEPGEVYPICLKGVRACPPEDCGGVWGYAELIDTLADPSHPEHEEKKEWIGEDFDPEAFELERVNQQLRGGGVIAAWMAARNRW